MNGNIQIECDVTLKIWIDYIWMDEIWIDEIWIDEIWIDEIWMDVNFDGKYLMGGIKHACKQ